jgi:hypothetical protein
MRTRIRLETSLPINSVIGVCPGTLEHAGRESTNLRSVRADDGTRTRYLELGKLALYQVSYVRESDAFYGGPAAVVP